MVQTHAFVSYVRENSTTVDRLAADLRNAGIQVWLDRDDIMPGQRWKDAISGAIHRGAFFIACYSKEFSDRQETYMHAELRFAIDRLRNMPKNRVWFIPVFLNQTDIPSHNISDHETLRDINTVALYVDWGSGLKAVLRAMSLEDPDHRRVLHLIDLIKYHPRERDYAIEQLVSAIPLSPTAIPALAGAIPALIGALDDVMCEVYTGASNLLGEIGAAPPCQ